MKYEIRCPQKIQRSCQRPCERIGHSVIKSIVRVVPVVPQRPRRSVNAANCMTPVPFPLVRPPNRVVNYMIFLLPIMWVRTNQGDIEYIQNAWLYTIRPHALEVVQLLRGASANRSQSMRPYGCFFDHPARDAPSPNFPGIREANHGFCVRHGLILDGTLARNLAEIHRVQVQATIHATRQPFQGHFPRDFASNRAVDTCELSTC